MARLPESTPFPSGGEQQSTIQDYSFSFLSENLAGLTTYNMTCNQNTDVEQAVSASHLSALSKERIETV